MRESIVQELVAEQAKLPELERDLSTTRDRIESAQRPSIHKLVVRETGFQQPNGAKDSIQDLYATLASDPARNTSIVNDVIGAIQEGRSPILLTERKDQAHRYISEVFDDARLDTLFLAMPISWKGTLIQYCGRLHRHCPGKTEVRVYDYVDPHIPMLMRMSGKRLTTYRGIGYARGEAPLGFREPAEELTVEYDQEALRHFESDV